MTINPQVKLSCKASVTPSVPFGGGTYNIGMDNYELTVPAAADQIVTRTVTADNTGDIYEPDINSFDREGTQLNGDLGAVAMDTLYGVIIENNDASVNLTVACSSDLGSTSQVVPPGGVLALFNMTGWTISSSTTITLTAASGTVSVDIVCLGKNA